MEARASTKSPAMWGNFNRRDNHISDRGFEKHVKEAACRTPQPHSSARPDLRIADTDDEWISSQPLREVCPPAMIIACDSASP